MNEIGILGGSFDPFHLGHLSIAEAAIEELNLTKVILIPTKVSPFKLGKKMASEKDRVAMTRLAAQEDEKFEVSTIETDRSSVSYTYKTLELLKKSMEDTKIWFMMGTDSFVSLESWYKGQELLEEYSFAVAARPGFDVSVVEYKAEKYRVKYGAEVRILHNRMLDISSTEIKEAIKEGRSIEGYVPQRIERYIDEHGLYK
ncbi:nicotinate (nicotinamide) nucleotide adenylyltransferase [Aminicella lysinilytica]|uniref:nicotinate (nicotinamide) nucleotide adenylyltransferase n=1 Tax=Aminicella lysinilytica TaxID=433323 RepID=UPI0026EA9E71|nr:nicotinate (nicotinamide) nucleotide adenylyltransferase [Aminicella lysinilytica]